MKILSGTSNRPLAESIAACTGIPIAEAAIFRFADREISLEIQEDVQGQDIFVIQSTSCPANDNLMELLIMLDALKRGAARHITVVIPYYGYGRQDRKTTPRSPISARLVANLLAAAGANRILSVDWHSAQIEGFFDIPSSNIALAPLFSDYIRQQYSQESIVLVSPDVGGVIRTRVISQQLEADMAIIDKRRINAGAPPLMNLIGDVKGRQCIIIDDLVDSAGTLCEAAKILTEAGALRVDACVSHGVLSGKAIGKIEQSFLQRLIISDTIMPGQAILDSEKVKIISVAALLGRAICQIAGNNFTNKNQEGNLGSFF